MFSPWILFTLGHPSWESAFSGRLFEVARASWAKPRPFNGHRFHRMPPRTPSKLDQQLPLAPSDRHHPAMRPTSPVYTDDTLAPTARRFPSSRSVDCMCPLSMREFAKWVKNKQVVVGCRWTEERIQIDDDIGR